MHMINKCAVSRVDDTPVLLMLKLILYTMKGSFNPISLKSTRMPVPLLMDGAENWGWKSNQAKHTGLYTAGLAINATS